MTFPWILTLPVLALRSVLRALRAVGLLLMHGPGYFCWHFGCWEPVWSGCVATKDLGNGRMCRDHCESSCYHSLHRTGCDKEPTAMERYLYPETYREKDMGHAHRVSYLRPLAPPQERN